jgi:lipoate-protein ligase A
MGQAPWRLIVDGSDDGAWNMAVDEAILRSYERPDSFPGPTLRLYGWEPATLSIGRTQRADRAHDPEFLAREGLGLVRRPTGGGAVLHEFERTYSVAGALGVPPFTGGVVATYEAIAEALRRSLERLGVAASSAARPRKRPRDGGPVCFESLGAWEIAAHGRKLVGSAQARRRGAVLQHGSIPFRADPSRLAAAVGTRVDGSAFTDLERAAGAVVQPSAFDAACIEGFEATFGVRLAVAHLAEREQLLAAELRCWKYDSMAWTYGGAIGAREARWGPAVSG